MAQYRFVKLLAGDKRNVCVVGDDDQSIYGWRGADIRNILEFEKDFHGAKTVRLEQNYRSTSVILDAANAVIENNMGRKKKKLWTQEKGGALITNFTASDERHEAQYICSCVLEGARNAKRYDDYAVLYRTNAQSRIIETLLMGYGIPYKVYGGTRFYDRQEIRDIMAYLKLIANPADDISFDRIVNLPRRGIGDVAKASLAADANERGIPMFLAALEPGASVNPRVAGKFSTFANKMMEFIALRDVTSVAELTRDLIASIEYDAYLRDDKKENYENRIENIKELIGAMEEFEKGLEDETLEEMSPLQAFLENAALVSDTDSMEEDNGHVALMTMHSAKGLEFPVVFIAGMEENIFPSMRALKESEQEEEERRLCYVGITRARKELHLLRASQRMLYGNLSVNRPSRFLDEIPASLFAPPVKGSMDEKKPEPVRDNDFHRNNQATSRPAYSSFIPNAVKGANLPSAEKSAKASFNVGERVKHATFGEGTILKVEGAGTASIVQIDFGAKGVKKFATAYAPITKTE